MTVTLDPQTISPVNVGERKELDIRSGDTVRIHQKIREKGKIRIQIFEGLVLARKHGTEAGGTFTVRATMSGVGVEKIFPLYSPMIDKIEIIRRSKVRRAKLYYIRDKVAREIRRQLRNMSLVSFSTESEREVADRAAADAEMKAKEEEARLQKEAEEKAQAEAEAAAKAAAEAPPVEEVVAEAPTETSTEETKEA